MFQIRLSFASEDQLNDSFGALRILYRPTPMDILSVKLEHSSAISQARVVPLERMKKTQGGMTASISRCMPSPDREVGRCKTG